MPEQNNYQIVMVEETVLMGCKCSCGQLRRTGHNTLRGKKADSKKIQEHTGDKLQAAVSVKTHHQAKSKRTWPR